MNVLISHPESLDEVGMAAMPAIPEAKREAHSRNKTEGVMSVAGWHKVHGAGRHRKGKKEWIGTALWLSRKCQTFTSVLESNICLL